MNEEHLKEFKKMVEKHDGLEIFIGKGRKEVNVRDIKTKEFLDKVVQWGENSFKGLVCGIYGCVEPVEDRCKICKGGYCNEHKQVHIHVAGNEGIILRNFEDGTKQANL